MRALANRVALRQGGDMDLVATLVSLATCIAVAALCGWRGSHPPNPLKGPRLIPYRFLMVVAAGAALILVVHLVNLAGVTTGRDRGF